MEGLDKNKNDVLEKSSFKNLSKPGNIILGYKDKTDFIPVYLKLKDMLQHTLVAAKTGGGKSMIMTNIIEQILNENIPVLAIDFKGSFNYLAFLEDQDNMKSLEELISTKILKNHKIEQENLGIYKADIELMKKNTEYRFFTLDKTGYQLGKTYIPQPPILDKSRREYKNDLITELKTHTEYILDWFMVSSSIKYFFDRDTLELYFKEILKLLWKDSRSGFEKSSDYERLRLFHKYIKDPPFEKFIRIRGHLSIEESLIDLFGVAHKKALKNILNKLGKIFYKKIDEIDELGDNIIDMNNIDKIIGANRPSNKTVCSIISLNHNNTTGTDKFTFFNNIIKSLYYWGIRSTELSQDRPKLIVVIDECSFEGWLKYPAKAQQDSFQTALANCINTLKKFGIGFVFATQRPLEIAPRIRNNIVNYIFGKLEKSDLSSYFSKDVEIPEKYFFHYKNNNSVETFISPVSRCVPVDEFSSPKSLKKLIEYTKAISGTDDLA